MWSRGDCRASLCAATAAVDGPLRIIDYRAWRQTQTNRRPSDAVIVTHLGPWTPAVRSVGGRTVHFTPADCVAALVAAATDLQITVLRQVDYQTWAATNPGRPEQQAIIHHLGPWSPAVGAVGLIAAGR